jgi:DNA modification methylase
MNINEIKINPDNPRIIKDEKFKKLVASIKDFPKMMALRPIIVDDTMTILGGNMRYNALREAGFEEIPDNWVKQAKDLTEKEKKQFIIKDNLPFGEWDWDILGNNFEIKDLLEWGFDEKDLKIEQDVEEDEAPEVSDEPAISKLGEVYQLGRHRLMCGDSTKIEDVEKLMDGKKADMVFTDPPYGMDLDTDYSKLPDDKSKPHVYKKIIGDNKDFNFLQFDGLEAKEQFWWGGDYYADELPKSGSWFVWDKRVEEKYDAMIGSAFELCWSKQKHKREIVRVNNSLFSGDTEERSNRVHPTQKPIKVCSWFISKFSKQDNTILDLFGGSGSTLIACEQTNRTCYMMEIDPKYCDVIRKRYAKFIGKEDEWQTTTPIVKQ